jgi:hypothetical protein
MFWLHADPLRGQVGGGWALEIETFLGPVKWLMMLSECHLGPKKVEMSRAQVMDLHASKTLRTWPYKS